MDTDSVHETSLSIDDCDREAEIDKVCSVEGFVGEMIGHLRRDGELLKRVELNIACSSEKLLNLNGLMMNVATRESEFEAFSFKKEHVLADSFEKALEFDLLSRILYSEVREVQDFVAALQTETVHARELISACKHFGGAFLSMEEKLLDSEESLKQLKEQVFDIRMQSATLRRTLTCFDGSSDKGADIEFLKDEQLLDVDSRIKLQTPEQQRDILLMLEKSLAREMDLEKMLSESSHVEEELKLRLFSYENELFCIEEETSNVWEKLFEADNAAAVLMGISKELLARVHRLQINLNVAFKREDELLTKFESARRHLKSKESILKRLESGETRLNDFLVAQADSLKASLIETEEKLILVSSEAFTLREKVSSLQSQLKNSEFQRQNVKDSLEGSPEDDSDIYYQISELENVIEDMKEKIYKAENRAESAEARCKLLAETNMELNDEVCLLKGSGGTCEKVESLERQLHESEIQLQQAAASAEASQEKQNMLCSKIGDMESLIEDLKLKVLKAESSADSAEETYIRLSESNADLNEELNFQRERLERLEAALYRSEGIKLATAKDIGIRTKVITNLIMQLAVERERLHKQISSLAKENKMLVVKLQQTNNNSYANYISQGIQENGKNYMFCKDERATCRREEEDEGTDVLIFGSETGENIPDGVAETEAPPETSTGENIPVGEAEMESPPETSTGENIPVGEAEMEAPPETSTGENIPAGEVEMEAPREMTTGDETVRRSEGGVVSTRHVSMVMAILVLLIAAVFYLFQQ